jgi:Ca2+-binding RTX toxin-like protein
MPTFPAVVDVASMLDGTSGFRINGVALDDGAGTKVAGIGDVNGDGIDDIAIGAYNAHLVDVPGELAAYVVFGTATGFPEELELTTLDGSNGFRVEGIVYVTYTDYDVTAAGDVNGDGIADLMVSGSGGDGDPRYPGVTYVIYGSTDGFAPSIATASLDGSNGFAIKGTVDFGEAGEEISSIGDFNGDGYDDILISKGDGAAAHVVYGSAEAPAAEISLPDLDGSNGFTVVGPSSGTGLGWDVAGIGDFNHDGYDDFVIGSPFNSPDSQSEAGSAYVVFGAADGIGNTLDLSTLDGTNGFRLDGAMAGDWLGLSVSDAGDVNGDGYADFIVGATGADPHGHKRAGEAYVVFGRAGNFQPTYDADLLNGKNGFVIRGDIYGHALGTSVSAAGDLNGDGYDDVTVSLTWNVDQPGTAYVIYGKSDFYTPGIDVTALDGTNGFRIDGVPRDMFQTIDGAGDINGDGFDDLVIGAPGALSEGVHSKGAAYVIYGEKPSTSVVRTDSNGDQTIHGGSADDWLASGTGRDLLIGYEGNDRLISTRGADTLDGGLGDDTYLVTNDHDDTIIDAGGNDTIRAWTHWDLRDNPEIENLIVEADGNWHLTGNESDNRLTGNQDDNVLRGLGGDDTLIGGAGDDVLIGGNAADWLTGGGGSDRFDFVSLSEVGVGIDHDTITDFTSGEDTIFLGGIDADLTVRGNQAFHLVDELSGAAGELAVYQQGGNTLVDADVDADGIVDFQIVLSGLHTLTAADFIL